MERLTAWLAVPLLAAIPGLTACGDATAPLTVFAAASLTDVIEPLVRSFEDAHPDAEVIVSTAGSQRLAIQILDGAPADVFLSADARRVAAVADQTRGDPVPFATAEMVIAVPPGNPHDIRRLEDLADPDLSLVLPAPQVPAGAYAGQVLADAGVTVRPVDLTLDVRAAVTKVALGEADAAIVYATDVLARGDELDAVVVPTDVEAAYLAVVLQHSAQQDLAAAFVEHLVSETGQAILADHGFGPP